MASRLTRFNLCLFLGCFHLVGFILLAFQLAVDPIADAHKFFEPPHRREGLFLALKPSLEATDYRQAMADFKLPPHLVGWLLEPDGTVCPIGELRKSLPYDVPNGVWQGRRAQICDDDGFYAFFWHARGVVVLFYPDPGMAGEFLNKAKLTYFFATVLGLLPVLVLTWRRARRVEQPLRHIDDGLRRLADGKLDHRVGDFHEFGHLQSAFNSMAERLEGALDSLRSQKERAEQAEQARRDFLADVSHNLGTPLAAIQGWIGFLKDDMVTDPGERRRLLIKLSRQVHRVSRTVHQLLQLSRWENAEPELMIARFPLLKPLIEVAESLEEMAQDRDISLYLDRLHPRLCVRADQDRIRDLFQIFLENAIAHAGAGVEVRVSARLVQERVVVVVSDNGEGVPSHRLPSLKQRFVLASGKGCGLGLAIADRLVSVHGGRLTIDSEPGHGTRLTFDLAYAGYLQEREEPHAGC